MDVVILLPLLALAFVGCNGVQYNMTKFVNDSTGNIADENSTIIWSNLPKGKPYKALKDYDDGGLGVLFDMARAFVNVVFSQPLPYDIVEDAMADISKLTANYTGPLYFALGFVICLVVGFLFICLMPLCGCCFCCCRLCGNCGGKRRQDPNDVSNCHRITFTVLLFVFTTMIIVPGIVTYVANDQTSTALSKLGSGVTDSLSDLPTYLDNTMQEINHVALNNLNFTQKVLFRDLNNLGEIVGKPVMEDLEKVTDISAVMTTIGSLDAALQNLSNAMTDVATKTQAFVNASVALNVSLRANAAAIDSSAASGCNSGVETFTCAQVFRTDKMVIDASPSGLPDVGSQMDQMQNASGKSLKEIATDAMSEFYSIPNKVADGGKTAKTALENEWDTLYTALENALGGVSDLSSNLDTIDSISNDVSSYSGTIKTYEQYRWLAGIGLTCILMVIGALQLIALVMGTICYRSKISPAERSCPSNASGNMLMAAAGFCFIFSWLLMLLVTLPFLIGSLFEKVVCQPLLDPDYAIFKNVIDKPGLLGNGYILGNLLLKNGTINLTIHGILESCKNNETAFRSLKLDSTINMNELTDYKSKFDIGSQLSSFSVDLSGTTILTDDLRKTMDDFKGALSIDYDTFINETNKPATGANLTGLILSLDNAAAATTVSLTKASLQTNSDGVNLTQSNLVPQLLAAKTALRDSVIVLRDQSPTVIQKINDTMDGLQKLQDRIRNNATAAINKSQEIFIDRTFRILDQYVDQVKKGLDEDIGVCRPLYDLYYSLVGIVVCKYTVDTLNGFWFSLGWAVAFFIPSIIFDVKLAKYYRTMECDEGSPKKKTKKKNKNKVTPL